MRKSIAVLLALVFAVAFVAAQARNTLDIYVVDVEGGNATLFVTPSGESFLMDTGNANGAVRDAERIVAAAKDAGITQIDHLLITHWHGDHFGGLSELAARMPIRELIDHGPNVQPNPNTDKFIQETYGALAAKGKRTIVKPGDRIAMNGLDVRVLTANEEVLKTPLAGGGQANPACANFQKAPEGNAEDRSSLSVYVGFGKFRTAHFGDILRNQEYALMCPRNPIGTIDLLLGLHHGQASSNSPVLVHALRPRVGIMNDGTRKGGEPDTIMSVASSPGFEDLWQLHFSLLSGQEYTQPGMFIANSADDAPAAMPIAPYVAPAPGGTPAPPAPVHNGQAYWIKVSARQDGTFTVTNQRNNFSKTYSPR